MQSLIQKALEDYKEKIDSKKPNELALSEYTVNKPNGFEKWLEINEFYTFKLIHIKAGCRSSLQKHEYKWESNFVISGKAEVLLEDKDGNMQSYIIEAGNGWTVPTGRKHRVIALQDYTAIEASTSHLDDVVRFEDDYNRGNGMIDSEHSV